MFFFKMKNKKKTISNLNLQIDRQKKIMIHIKAWSEENHKPRIQLGVSNNGFHMFNYMIR
jgi:hypothetical protein